MSVQNKKKTYFRQLCYLFWLEYKLKEIVFILGKKTTEDRNRFNRKEDEKMTNEKMLHNVFLLKLHSQNNQLF